VLVDRVLEVGVLEVGVPEVGVLEVGVLEVGVLGAVLGKTLEQQASEVGQMVSEELAESKAFDSTAEKLE
jgi:hypothetical protein